MNIVIAILIIIAIYAVAFLLLFKIAGLTLDQVDRFRRRRAMRKRRIEPVIRRTESHVPEKIVW